jgi:hypothetical protein
MRLISGKFSIVMLLRTEEDLEMMTAVGEPDEESGVVMEKPELTTNAVKTGLQMT